MFESLSTSANRNRTLLLLAICGLLAIAAVALGIDENPPGILLAFLAAIAFVLAFVHPWRTAKKFLYLLLASLLGIILFIGLSILIDSITQNPATSGTIRNLIQNPVIDGLNLIFVMIVPAAFLVGAVGGIVMFIRGLRRST